MTPYATHKRWQTRSLTTFSPPHHCHQVDHVSVGVAKPSGIHQHISACLCQVGRISLATWRQVSTVELQIRFVLKEAPTVLSSALYDQVVREYATPSRRAALSPISHATKCRCWISENLCHSAHTSRSFLDSLCWPTAFFPTLSQRHHSDRDRPRLRLPSDELRTAPIRSRQCPPLQPLSPSNTLHTSLSAEARLLYDWPSIR